MSDRLTPKNAAEVKATLAARLSALTEATGLRETLTVEWRGAQETLPVITVPVDLLSYNPWTHRIRAQRTLDPARDRELEADPYGEAAQLYLHQLLMSDPTDPTKIDPSFEALKEDIRAHGQNDPGLVTRTGVLINGNTRRAALKSLNAEFIRVGVLPADASLDDVEGIELSLQLRKEHKRDYSFVNFLLAIDERVAAGRSPGEIQSSFRIKASTFERSRWILALIREAIQRSTTVTTSGDTAALRLVDFESHQGKLEELYRSYISLRRKSPEEAEALREQRLLGLALGGSKTDLRLIEPDFAQKYLKPLLTSTPPPQASRAVRIPGTNITAAEPDPHVLVLKELTNRVLRAKAIAQEASAMPPDSVSSAATELEAVSDSLQDALDAAGKTSRVVKRRFAPTDRLSDANDHIELCIAAVAEARGSGAFDSDDLDEELIRLKRNLLKLAQLAAREATPRSPGVGWLQTAAELDTAGGL